MLCPRRRRARAQASSVEPVTITSSTRTTRECGARPRTLMWLHRRCKRSVLSLACRGAHSARRFRTGPTTDIARHTGKPPARWESVRAITTVGQNPREKNPLAEGGTGTRTRPVCVEVRAESARTIAGLTRAAERVRTPPSFTAATTRRRAPRYEPPEITGTPRKAVATASEGDPMGA